MKTLRILLSTAALMVITSAAAFAQTGGQTFDWSAKMGPGLAIGIAAFGCAIAMGRAISAALEGVSRNPSAGQRIMTMMILGLALIESLAIYALVIAFMIK